MTWDQVKKVTTSQYTEICKSKTGIILYRKNGMYNSGFLFIYKNDIRYTDTELHVKTFIKSVATTVDEYDQLLTKAGIL